MTKHWLTRRNMLRAGLGVGLSAGVASAFGLTGAMRAEAEVGCTPVFKLDGNGGNPVNEVPLKNSRWHMQNFAWDSDRSTMYFTQTEQGSSNGDLLIVRTTTSGETTGSMTVRGFGHGQGFTVEPTSDGVMVWTEYRSGTRVARFPFKDGTDLEGDDESLEDRTPQLADVDRAFPFYDSVYDRMWYWFLSEGKPRIVGYTMDDARAGRLGKAQRLAEVHMPPVGDDPAFQGFAVCGGWAYLLEGSPPPPGDNDPSQNRPAYLSTWNIDEKKYGTKRFRTRVGDKFMQHKEPEGMSLWIVDGKPRLGFGVTSVADVNTDPVTRQASVYYKSDFVSSAC